MLMRKIAAFLIVLLVIMLVSLTACSKVQEEPEKINPPRQLEPEPLPSTTPAPAAEKKLAPAVQALVDKGKAITNYKYTFDSGLFGPSYEVYVRGNLVKKILADTVKLDQDIFYNEVYMDLTARTATAICSKSGSVSCQSHYNEAFTVPYTTERPAFFPVDLFARINTDAKIVGKERFDNRDTTIIEYTNVDGKKERLWIENYYGLPVRQEIYASSETSEVLEKHTFTQINVGNVLTADVTVPEQYKLVS